MLFKPIIAFMGVRISWLMLERKEVFALFAFSATARASFMASRLSDNSFFCSWSLFDASSSSRRYSSFSSSTTKLCSKLVPSMHPIAYSGSSGKKT